MNSIARTFSLTITLMLPVSVLSQEVSIKSFNNIAYAWMERGSYVYATTNDDDIYLFLCDGNKCSSGVLLFQGAGDSSLYDVTIMDGLLYFLVGDEYGGRLGSIDLKCMSIGDCSDRFVWHDVDGFRLVSEQNNRELYIEKDDGLYSVRKHSQGLSLGKLVEGTSIDFHDYAWFNGKLFFASYADSQLGSSISVMNVYSGEVEICRIESGVKYLNVLSNEYLVFISSGYGFSRELKAGRCDSDMEVLYSQKPDDVIESVKVSSDGEVLFQVRWGRRYELRKLNEKVTISN